jgi:type I restriction enzyme S subunit
MSKVLLGDVAIEHKETCKGSKDGYPIVGLEHLVPEEITLTAWDEGSENTFTKMFRKGNVLFGRRRAYLKKAAVAPFDGICSGDITVIEAKPDRILPELLPFIIQNDALFDFAVGKSAGSLSPRVKWEHLKNFEFELPNMDKQKELATLLWAMDDTKKSYQKLIAATDELVKSQFIEMFGVPGTDPFGWGLTTLGNCSELNPRKPKNMDQEAEYTFLPMTAVSDDGRIDTSTKRPYRGLCKGFTYFAEKDVLFAKITPCMENGKGAVAIGLHNKAGFGSTEFHVLRPIEGISDPYWIYIITMFPKFRSDAEKVMTGTGGQRRVPITYLNEYKIALPPIDLQEQFAAFVRQSDKSKFELEQALAELTATYKRIIAENLG